MVIDRKSRSKIPLPAGFCVKSIATARAFMDMLPAGSEYHIQDIEDSRKFYAVKKTAEGNVLFGCGNLFGAKGEVVPVDYSDPAVAHNIFYARKSINRWFFR